jgi:hypothetical protein
MVLCSRQITRGKRARAGLLQHIDVGGLQGDDLREPVQRLGPPPLLHAQ